MIGNLLIEDAADQISRCALTQEDVFFPPARLLRYHSPESLPSVFTLHSELVFLPFFSSPSSTLAAMYPIADLTAFCRRTSGDVPPKLVVSLRVISPVRVLGSRMFRPKGCLNHRGGLQDVPLRKKTPSFDVFSSLTRTYRAVVSLQNARWSQTSICLTSRPCGGRGLSSP